MNAKILIVEDEAITALDIEKTLENADFEIVSIVSNGEEAIKKAEELKPDLMLIDVFIKGEMDGIQAANKIMTFFDIPVIYLTAFSDKNTFERAKLTKPYGFLTKPIDPNELKASIDIALYKHDLDKKIKENEEKYQLLYEDAPLPYQSLNESGHIIEVNQAWLDTLGYSKEEVIGKWFGNFLKSDNTKKFAENFPKFKVKGEICDIEFEMKRKDESTLYTEFNGKILYDEHGNFQRTHCIFQDITKQIEAEKKLKDSERHYKLFFNNPLMGFALCKILTDNENNPVDFIYLKVNKAFENLTGLKKEAVLNEKVTDVLIPEEVAEVIQIYGKVALTGKSTIFEYPIPSLDKYYEIFAFSPQNKHFIAFFTDITERKKAEEKLREAHVNLELNVQKRTRELQEAYKLLGESEHKFREIFNNANDMITLNEMEDNFPGKFIEVNEVGIKRLDYSRDEFLKMTPSDLIFPEESKQKITKALLKKGHIQVEHVDIAKNGSKIPVEVNLHLFKLKGKKVTLAISRDISERKKMENALKESEEKYRELFNKAIDMITLSEIKSNGMPGKYIEVNEVGIKRLGYSREEFLNLSPVDIVAPEYRDEMPKNALAMAEKGSSNFEIVHITKDGKRIPVEINGHIINYREKKAYLTVSHDITERKISEEKLQKTIQELKRSNEELQSFAYITSHDLQEPLRTIASFTQLLERRYKGKLDNDADEFMDYIVNASKRMKDMIQGLLEYSRIDREEKGFIKTDMNVKVEKAISNLYTAIDESNAEITYDPLPTVCADPDNMVRVFQNFIGNAIKFKKPQLPPRIHVSVRKDVNNDEWIFSVADRGIGMKQQYTTKIFDVFRRLHTTEEYNGTGIGLAIIKRIIERHGGRVWVESELGVGSTFYFSIPFCIN